MQESEFDPLKMGVRMVLGKLRDGLLYGGATVTVYYGVEALGANHEMIAVAVIVLPPAFFAVGRMIVLKFKDPGGNLQN